MMSHDEASELLAVAALHVRLPQQKRVRERSLQRFLPGRRQRNQRHHHRCRDCRPKF